MPFEESNSDKLIHALRNQMKETERLKQLNRELVAARSEPIAIIGMGCRFPGAVDSPEAFWQLLASGNDAITEIPAERGWDMEGLSRREPALRDHGFGGFVDDIAGFDPQFFGIGSREAVAADPQQRLLLETAWEALEYAGIVPASLMGSQAGVFVGMTGNDYFGIAVEEFLGFGALSPLSVGSGRIAYTLGLRGPTLTVDTACSSALVTLHLACHSLRQAECDLALAGGVTLMTTPGTFYESSAAGMLATPGRCKPFASSEGMLLGEGVGMLVLERVADARRNGHEILALVRGSAVNHAGRSQGLIAPNGPAQEDVIRRALANAGLTFDDVDALEGHGTGTPFGDQIEAQAVLATYGSDRAPGHPLYVGSSKANIGHSQTAAGVAGVIKMVLALRHQLLPKTPHIDEPSPTVDWSLGTVKLLQEPVAFRPNGRPRRAAVSAFGISGTNAHVIIEEPPSAAAEPARAASGPAKLLPFVISGRSQAALRAQAARLHAHLLADPELSLLDVAHSLAVARSAFEVRSATVAADREALLAQLRALAAGDACEATVSGQARARGRLAFVFPSQDTAWPGIARQLLDESEVFARRMQECALALAPYLPCTLEAALRGGPLLAQPAVAQPLSFAIAVSLAALWRSKGVEPDAVVGHGQGEIAAACVAGALSLDDAARLVALWARTPDASSSTNALSGIAALPTQIPFYSSQQAALLAGEALDAEYWQRGMREPVRFAEAIDKLRVDGHGCFLEISMDPRSIDDVQAALTAAGATGAVVGSLQRDAGDMRRLLLSLCELHVLGWSPRWSQVIEGGRFVRLPTYAFQRERYWPSLETRTRDLADSGLQALAHPLLGTSLRLADGQGMVFTARLSRTSHGWLGARKLQDACVVPLSLFVDFALCAAEAVGLDAIEQLRLAAPLELPEHGALRIQLTLSAADADGKRALTIHAQPDEGAGDASWTAHAHGVLAAAQDATHLHGLEAWPPDGAQPIELAALYPALAELGLRYDEPFRGLIAAYRRDAELFGEVELPAASMASAARYALHPALFEGACQLLALDSEAPEAQEATSCEGVTLRARGAKGLRVRASLGRAGEAQLELADEAGEPLGRVECLRSQPLTAATSNQPTRNSALYHLNWQTLPPASGAGPVHWYMVGAEHPAGIPLPAKHCIDLDEASRLLGYRPEIADVVVLLVWEPDTQFAGVTPALGERLRHVVETWLADPHFATCRLVVLTKHAQRVSDDDRTLDATHALLWGAIRSLQVEYPERRFGLLDWDGLPATGPTLVTALASGEAQLAVRGSQLFTPRVAQLAVSDAIAAGEKLMLSALDSVVITGASSPAAAALARHLVREHGPVSLVLGSSDADSCGLVAELEAAGATVHFAICDVRERSQVEALLQCVPDSAPLAAIFHLSDEPQGAWHLHDLTRELDLKAFVLFASLTGTLGQSGGAEQGGADGFVEAVAHLRRLRGLRAHVVNVGMWPQPETAGLLRPMTYAQILGSLELAMTLAETQLIAATFDPSLAELPAERVPTPLHGLLPRRLRRAGALGGEPGGLKARLRRVAPHERPRVLLDTLLDVVGEVLRLPKSQLDPERPLTELGMDSLRALELRNFLAAYTQLALPPTLLFDHPTPRSLSQYFEARLVAAANEAVEGPAPSSSPLITLCQQANTAGSGPETRSVVWHLMDAATRARQRQPGGQVKTGLISKPYVLTSKPGRRQRLICTPAVMPPVAPSQYMRLANAVEGEHEVVMVSYPGYGTGEALPADRQSLIACLSDAVLASAQGEEFVLAGWSSGGWIAHCVATELEQRGGHSPAALVVFDSRLFPPEEFYIDPITHACPMRDRTPVFGSAWTSPTCDEELTAWVSYFELFSDWKPRSRVACPSLQVVPTLDFVAPGLSLAAREQELLPTSHEVEVEADHISMLMEFAPRSTSAMDTWLDSLPVRSAATPRLSQTVTP